MPLNLPHHVEMSFKENLHRSRPVREQAVHRLNRMNHPAVEKWSAELLENRGLGIGVSEPPGLNSRKRDGTVLG